MLNLSALVARQHGFLLRSQIPDELYLNGQEKGYFPQSNETPLWPNVVDTPDADYSFYGRRYALWLALLPTIAPEHRATPPVLSGVSALEFYGYGNLEAHTEEISMPEQFRHDCLQHDDVNIAYTFETLPKDNWQNDHDVPVEKPLYALKKLADEFHGSEFDWVSYAYQDAFELGGFTFEELSATLADSAEDWAPGDGTPEAACRLLLALDIGE